MEVKAFTYTLTRQLFYARLKYHLPHYLNLLEMFMFRGSHTESVDCTCGCCSYFVETNTSFFGSALGFDDQPSNATQ